MLFNTCIFAIRHRTLNMRFRSFFNVATGYKTNSENIHTAPQRTDIISTGIYNKLRNAENRTRTITDCLSRSTFHYFLCVGRSRGIIHTKYTLSRTAMRCIYVNRSLFSYGYLQTFFCLNRTGQTYIFCERQIFTVKTGCFCRSVGTYVNCRSSNSNS